MAWAVGQTADPAELAEHIAAESVWIAADEQVLGAFLIAGVMDGEFYIDEISVAASHQRRGVGRTLIETALADAKRRRYRAAKLTTDRSLPWNAPYYARIGFRILEAATPPQLAARLASQPNPERRCAMQREL